MHRVGRRIYRLVVATLDRLLERLVAFRPHRGNTSRWQALIGASLLLAFLVRSQKGEFLSLDLFLIPVLLSAALFRNRGLWIVPFSALAYFLSGWLCVGIDKAYLPYNTLGQILEWGLLAGFALVTLDRYGALKRLQGRLNQDVELARRLQLALMQNRFELGSVRLCGKVSQTLEVGGDFFYFRPFGQKYVVFCLGDVMGKGIAASLLMALIMGFMFEWGKKSPSPAFVLRKLNQRLTQWNQQQGSFVTMVYAVYDEEEQRLHYANAGHPPALLLRQNGDIEQLEGTGLPLGVLDSSEWEEAEVALSEGDRLILYSDGLLEARDHQGREFEMDALVLLLRLTQRMPLDDALQHIENQVRRHCNGKLSDDLAILMMERR